MYPVTTFNSRIADVLVPRDTPLSLILAQRKSNETERKSHPSTKWSSFAEVRDGLR